MRIPELLAPAGALPQLKAALRFGADAVYGGLQRFGLRAFAGNFSMDDLAEAVGIAHKLQKRFYVTLNAFPFDDEMDGFIETARAAHEIGVDAAIVSDLGAIRTLRKAVPALDIHVSTQANTLNTPAALAYAEMGVKRIILARELSLERMANLRSRLTEAVELEAFCHGAACVSYSGRCLLSNVMTGRGANQGACAQPCRWKYAVMEEKRPGEYYPVFEDARGSYLFSAQDLNLMPLLPKLCATGLASLKIEGRMKTEYYVATVVSAYRRGLDCLAAGGPEAFEALCPELLKELSKASHRQSNTGFALGDRLPAAGAEGFHQSMEYVARIEEDAAAQTPCRVLLKNRFYTGDTLEVLSPSGARSYVPDTIVLFASGERVQTHGVGGDMLLLTFPYAVQAGDFIRGPVRNHRL